MTSVNEYLSELEERKRTLLSDCQTWPADQVMLRPEGESWSGVDVLEHLERTERSILGRMRDNVRQPHPVRPADTLRSAAVNTLFRTPARVKTPAGAETVLPTGTVTLDQVAAAWADTRMELQQFILENPHLTGVDGLFEHPVGGWMPLKTTLEFFAVHIAHHRFQLERIRRAMTAA